MKLHTAFCIAFVGLSTLACGGGGSSSTDLSAYSVALAAPWDGMNLPIGDGSVLYSDATTTTVNYNGGTVGDLTGKYDEAVKGQGWAESSRADVAGVTSITYSKDTSTLTLSVSEVAGMTSVVITKI